MQPVFLRVIAILFSFSGTCFSADKPSSAEHGIALLTAELAKPPIEPTDWARRRDFEDLWEKTCALAGGADAEVMGGLRFSVRIAICGFRANSQKLQKRIRYLQALR